jgi:hypothetical protein
VYRFRQTVPSLLLDDAEIKPRAELPSASVPKPQTVKTLLALAPLKRAPTLQRIRSSTPQQAGNLPVDRNREIAALHLRAIQQRSKSKRDVHQTYLEVNDR